MENIISFTVQKDEDKIIVHLEADKERFKATLMPLLDAILHMGPVIAKIPVPSILPPESAPEPKTQPTQP